MKIYHLKVSLFDYHEQPINKLHRIIEISEDSTFEALHEAIFEAFDRFDPHLYTFFMTKKDTKSMSDIMDAAAITNPYSVDEDMLFNQKSKNAATTTIKDAKLNEKDVFHYWFDFGDDWWHRIRVERITTNNKRKKPFAQISKKVGESPAQYGDEYGEGFDDFEMEGLDFEMMGLDESALAEIGIGEEDLLYLMDTMQGNKTEAIEKVVDKYGIDKIIAMFNATGVPESETKPIENMLKNIPIINFLESLENPDVTLQEERDLLETLINDLQVRLSDLEKSIAEKADQVSK